jgi:hypothetical protein
MRNTLKLSDQLALAFIAATIVSEAEVYAYLDAGTGSMILQAALGTIAAALVAGRVYWARIKRVFTRNSSRD